MEHNCAVRAQNGVRRFDRLFEWHETYSDRTNSGCYFERTLHASSQGTKRTSGSSWLTVLVALVCALVASSTVRGLSGCTADHGESSVSKRLELCTTTYGSLCGQSCSNTIPCPLGLRCADERCVAECTPITGCADGEVCSLAGICTAAVGVNSGTPCTPERECPQGFECDGDYCRARCSENIPCSNGLNCVSGICAPPTPNSRPATVEADACIDIDVSFERQTPTVVLLVDQSATMNEPFGPPGTNHTRWTVLRETLLSKETGIVPALQSMVEFGLTMYTGRKDGPQCPLLSGVPARPNNYESIAETYRNSYPIEDTPTGAAIRATTAALRSDAGSHPRYIVLVTDGLPDTCGDPDPDSPDKQLAANRDAVAAAQAAYASGVGLFVIGVASDIATEHLQQMANAGAGLDPRTAPPAAAPYWIDSSSQTDLATQLGTVVGSVRSCVFMLHGTVQPGYESLGTVVLDGERLSYADPNGWKLDTPSQLELVGTSCEKAKMAGQSLSIEFPCHVFVPIH